MLKLGRFLNEKSGKRERESSKLWMGKVGDLEVRELLLEAWHGFVGLL